MDSDALLKRYSISRCHGGTFNVVKSRFNGHVYGLWNQRWNISRCNNTGCHHNYSWRAIKFCGCVSQLGEKKDLRDQSWRSSLRLQYSPAACWVFRQGSLPEKMTYKLRKHLTPQRPPTHGCRRQVRIMYSYWRIVMPSGDERFM